jgi:hypothetical protein
VGALAILWIVGLTMAAQGFLALRAHNLAALSPIAAINNFVTKTQPNFHPRWACMSLNFSPGALVCHTVGTGGWTLQHVAVWLTVAALGAWAIHALRGQPATSWELFAFLCPLSAMLSPLAWSHYQILLAPLFVLLVVRFTTEGAGVIAWAGLAAAFVLSSLMWEPYGTSISAVNTLFSTRPEPVAQQIADANSVAAVAQYAQYVLVATGLWWYGGRFAGNLRGANRAIAAPSAS